MRRMGMCSMGNLCMGPSLGRVCISLGMEKFMRGIFTMDTVMVRAGCRSMPKSGIRASGGWGVCRDWVSIIIPMAMSTGVSSKMASKVAGVGMSLRQAMSTMGSGLRAKCMERA